MGGNEPLGIVEEAQRRRSVYAPFVDRALKAALEDGALREQIAEAVDARLKAEINRIVANRLERLKREKDALEGKPVVGLDAILATIAEVTGVEAAILRGPGRGQPSALARQFGYWFMARMRRDLTLREIAAAFRRIDHSSVSHGLKVIADEKGSAPLRDWMSDPRIVALLESA